MAPGTEPLLWRGFAYAVVPAAVLWLLMLLAAFGVYHLVH